MKTGAKDLGFLLADSVGAMVRMTHLAFAQDLQNHLAGHDIPVGMWFYLRALWEEDGITQRVLSQRVGATEPTTAQQLVNMEKRGFVERRRSSTDRRNSYVHLTPSGRALQRKLLPYAVAVNATALAGLAPEDVAQLRTLLGQLRENLLAHQQARAERGADEEAAEGRARRAARQRTVRKQSHSA